MPEGSGSDEGSAGNEGDTASKTEGDVVEELRRRKLMRTGMAGLAWWALLGSHGSRKASAKFVWKHLVVLFETRSSLCDTPRFFVVLG